VLRGSWGGRGGGLSLSRSEIVNPNAMALHAPDARDIDLKRRSGSKLTVMVVTARQVHQKNLVKEKIIGTGIVDIAG